MRTVLRLAVHSYISGCKLRNFPPREEKSERLHECTLSVVIALVFLARSDERLTCAWHV